MKTIKEHDYNLIINAKKDGIKAIYEYMKVYLSIDYYLDAPTLYYHLIESAFRILEINELKNLFENGIERQFREKMYRHENPVLGYYDLCLMIIDKFKNLEMQKYDEENNKYVDLYNIFYNGDNITYSQYDKVKVLKK